MSSTEEPGLGSKLATAFLDWYNLEYIVPQKPNYLSKDQSEDTQYSRYFIEQFIISAQKAEAKRNEFWGGVNVALATVAVLFAAPTMGLSVYLASFAGVATLATFTHGAVQIDVSNRKLNELAQGNYHTPELDQWQKGLDISGTAMAVVDLAMLGKSVANGARNLANDTKRAAMLTKIKNPALKQGLNKVGTKLGQAGKMATGAYEEAKSALNVGKTGQLGLDAVGAGSSAGKTGSRAVDGAETWYSSGGGGTGQFKEPVITKTNKGLEVEFVNPFGIKIKWVEQNPKNIQTAIQSAKNSSNTGRVIEGKVGEFVQQRSEVSSFGHEILDSNDIKMTDLDVVTKRQIIEVKKSASALKTDQIDRLIDPKNPQFFNYESKEVIVYIEESIEGITNPKTLEKIEYIKQKGIKIVNSLDELGGVLK